MRRTLSVRKACALVAAVMAMPAMAAVDHWNVNSDGLWSDVSKWASGTTYPNAVGDVAHFDYNITQVRTVALGSSITLGGMVFNDTDGTGQQRPAGKGYRIDLGSNKTITLDTGTAGYDAGDLVTIELSDTNRVGHAMTGSGGKLILVDNVLFNTTSETSNTSTNYSYELTLGSAGPANAGLLSGSGKLTKTGPGILILLGDSNTYNGTIRIEQGRVQGRGNATLGNTNGQLAFGTGTIELTNGGSMWDSRAALSLSNYYYFVPTFNNDMVLDQTHASNTFRWFTASTDYVWAGNLSSTSALTVNFSIDPYGKSSQVATLTGNNSGLTFAAGKGFVANQLLGIGSDNALGTGNSLLVQVKNEVGAAYQSGLLATTATTVQSPIYVHNSTSSAAVLGGTLTSGTAIYTGQITLNQNGSTALRQVFLRSESGGSVRFDSLITSDATNGIKAPVTKIGSGQIELNGNNTYKGDTTVRSGTLILGHNNALGNNTNAVNLGDATSSLTSVRLASTGYESWGTWTAPGTFTGASTSIDGKTLVAGDRVLIKDNPLASRNGVYVVQSTTSTWIRATEIDESSELAYGQNVYVSDGTLNIGKAYFQGQGGTLTLNSSVLDWHQDVLNPDASILLKSGVTLSRNISVVANGSTGKSMLGTNATSGVGEFTGAIALNRALTVTAASGGEARFSNDIAGGFGITKEGAGKVSFDGNKSYTGVTAVTAGVLEVNGNLASTQVDIIAGGTLAGSGNLAGVVVSNGGTLSPGNSPGTMTIAGLTLDGASNLNYDLKANDLTIGAGVNDLININGNLTLAGTLNVAVYGGTELSLGTYRLMNYTGTLVDNNLQIAGGLSNTRTYQINTNTAGQVNLVVSAIPEPASLGLLTLGSVLLAGRPRNPRPRKSMK